jgi:hypothetical protein
MRLCVVLASLSVGILSVHLFASGGYPHEASLDPYGCHDNIKRADYHCHRGKFAGRTFKSRLEMLRQIQSRGACGDGKKEDTATSKEAPSPSEIQANIENYFKELKKERTWKKEPTQESFSSALTVRAEEILVYARQDEHSSVIGRVKKGESLYPLAEAIGSSGVWYFVKTGEGKVGWIKGPNGF